MNKQDFKKMINKMRLDNKNSWVNNTFIVEDVPVGIKFFGTWIQRMEVQGFTSSTTMECSVKAFKDCIDNALKNIQ
jgi:hypothetical protein